MSSTPFALNPTLTAIAIGYQNTEDQLIADQVMPRVGTGETFKWTRYAAEQAYSVPDTRVGRKSAPNEVTFEGTDVTDSVNDYALDDFVPVRDMDAFAAMDKPAGGGPIPPDQLAVMMLSNLILLDREIRVAAMVFGAANYDAALRQTLSGTDQWSDYANSDPLGDLLGALDQPLIRPNTVTMGQTVWTQLRQHPKMVQAVYKTNQGAGSISRQQLAELLEVNQVLVGNSRLNTAKKGQTASFSRVWGKHVSLTYTSQQAAQTMQPTWGWTAQFGARIAGSYFDSKKGLKGSYGYRVGEMVKEVVAAPQSGYFIQNAVA